MAKRGTKQASFWLAVAGVSVMSPVVLQLTADRWGDKVPGFRDLVNFTTQNRTNC